MSRVIPTIAAIDNTKWNSSLSIIFTKKFSAFFKQLLMYISFAIIITIERKVLSLGDLFMQLLHI